MYAAGLYFVFLLLEDVIVGYYFTDAAVQNQDVNIRAAHDIIRSDITQGRDIIKQTGDNKQKFHIFFNISTTSEQPNKKWKLDKVTRKQYEIINMLWRKTKIFVNEDNIYTTNPTKRDNTSRIIRRRLQNEKNSIQFSSPTHSLHTTTTPSKIEFYYMDDIQDEANEKYCVEPNCERNTENVINSGVISNLPFLVFHLKGPSAEPQSVKLNPLRLSSQSVNEQVKVSKLRPNKPQKVTQQVKLEQNSFKEEVKNKEFPKAIHYFPLKKIFLGNTTLEPGVKSSVLNHSTTSNIDKFSLESTTIYDKIKFFEMYDQNTQTPYLKKTKITHNNKKVIDNNKKILLEHIEIGSHDHKQVKHAKKHIIENFQNYNKSCYQKTDKGNPQSNLHKMNLTQRQTYETSYVSNENQSNTLPSEYKFVFVNKTAPWSEFPFAAVYIYEPSQVHCDAAAINGHWLVASAACLSRASKKPYGGGRSAFVAYCGDQWWQPERVAYVKYSIVHPWFSPRDKTRKHLYNIGVIQVVNSMISACSGWAPVSLMSHQFAADPEGSWALAVGWGLDRIDTNYGTNLPKTPLMIYKGLLYFDSCPGNIGYSKAKRLDEGGWVRNVHCLSLPPYSGEDTDPVHGGLLLVEGKLIGLYLQEERRPWGEQSAQYTGIWRLIPWVMDMAKEPDEMDTIIFEI